MTIGPAIALAGLCKSFDGRPVLDRVDLGVDPGQAMVLIGPSGCGKTVLLKTVMGLLAPDSGSLAIGRAGAAAQGRPRRARMGMLFQQSALFDSLPVWENIAFRPLLEGALDRARAFALAADKIERVGLPPEVATLPPAALSGGMQRRAGLARAIVDDPEVLLLDEPTAGLDPVAAGLIDDLILDIVARLGATVLAVTSDMAGARRIADRAAMMFAGRIVWQGATAALDDSGDPHVDQFVHGRPTGPIPIVAG